MKKLLLFSTVLFLTMAVYAQQSPSALMAGKSEGKISVDEIIQAGKLSVSDTSCIIVKFALTMNAGSDLVSITSDSELITERMIKQLHLAEIGQKIYFEDIQIKKPDGSVAYLPPMLFVVK